MQIVVDHVTRMKNSRICVAGVNLTTLQHVRPITPSTDLITRKFLRENGGPFGPGALVDIGAVVARPNPPETEDHNFASGQASHIKDLDDGAYLDLLRQVSDPSISSAFGPDLQEIRPLKWAIHAGDGKRSLAVVPVVDPKLNISWDSLYLSLGPPNLPAKLRVTDVRFYEADHDTIKRSVVHDVNRRLASGVQALAMLGLARSMYDDGCGRWVHWLMANGLCLADRPVGDVP